LREEFYPLDFSDVRVCVMFLHGLLCRHGEDEPSSISVKFGGVGARFIALKGWGSRHGRELQALTSHARWWIGRGQAIAPTMDALRKPIRQHSRGDGLSSPSFVGRFISFFLLKFALMGAPVASVAPATCPPHPWDAINRVPTPSRHLYLGLEMGKMEVGYGDD